MQFELRCGSHLLKKTHIWFPPSLFGQSKSTTRIKFLHRCLNRFFACLLPTTYSSFPRKKSTVFQYSFFILIKVIILGIFLKTKYSFFIFFCGIKFQDCLRWACFLIGIMLISVKIGAQSSIRACNSCWNEILWIVVVGVYKICMYVTNV